MSYVNYPFAEKEIKPISAYNYVSTNGVDRIQLVYGVFVNGGKNGNEIRYKWKFKGNKIPFPIHSGEWIDGFGKEIMNQYMNNAGYMLESIVNMNTGSCIVKTVNQNIKDESIFKKEIDYSRLKEMFEAAIKGKNDICMSDHETDFYNIILDYIHISIVRQRALQKLENRWFITTKHEIKRGTTIFHDYEEESGNICINADSAITWKVIHELFPCDLTWKFIKSTAKRNKLHAILMYRDIMKCPISEAKEKIEESLKEDE